ncbi:hypothetical protein [Candidatus Tisiphia endosymbiont of Hybos culiciformis]|uniref:hypothetical protein n=1 Tax=Candidatus Tisiphia endosymbiont of Hybos culiciformis TaxID=3139331 RepID=UPI003CCB02A9
MFFYSCNFLFCYIFIYNLSRNLHTFLDRAAKTYYHHAFSLSQDENFKAAALKKIGNIMVNATAQGQDFITRGEEHDFYNYELVTEEFTKNLLGDVVLKCDLYC